MSTIKDVAREAGVSTATISKIINGRGGISKETTEKVLAVMKALDYTPDERAASLRRKANRTVAFLARIDRDTPYTNPHMFDILAGAEEYLHSEGYTMTLFNTYGKKSVDVADAIISSRSADALLIHAESVDRDLSLYLSRNDVKHIIIGHPHETRLCWIDTNHTAGGQAATEHLIERGYSRIAFIADDGRDSIGTARLEGFLDTMEMHGMGVDEDLVIRRPHDIYGACSAAEELLGKMGEFDSVITSSNLFAYGLAMVSEMKGVVIPRDFSLITFDRHPYTSIIRPMPTYVEIDVRAMGRSAGEMLLKELSSNGLRIQSFTTLPKIVEGKTTPMKEA